jgi:hypothetical protein
MAQEEKDLVLKDLSARQPYGVCVHIRYKEGEPCYGKLTPRDIQWFIDSKIESIKPYLRPMSSMTEEEEQIRIIYERDIMSQGFDGVRIYMSRYIDWLNSKHFDWRTDGNNKTLIEKGLALKAPEGMYNADAGKRTLKNT